MDDKDGEKGQSAPGKLNRLILVGAAVLALIMLGGVLYLQFTEQQFYEAEPSVWASPQAASGPTVVSETPLAMPPAIEQETPAPAPADDAEPRQPAEGTAE